jgi:hypothetical protein
MEKTLVMCLATLLCIGCGRPTVTGPDEVRASGQVVQVVLIDGFGEDPRTLTSTRYIRIGTYFDFRPYDSLQISFNATRVTSQLPFDEIMVRIGPSHYLRDSVYSTQENVSLRVKVPAVSKNQFCALTILTGDSTAFLQLSDLRVVGWMTK